MEHCQSTIKAEELLLIRSAKAGDSQAVRTLIDLHKDRLFCFVWRLVRHQQDVEDICQDAFLKAFESLESFDEQFRFSTWLFTIAYRLALNCLRRRGRADKSMDLANVSAEGVDHYEDVSDQVAASEQTRQIKQLIWHEVDKLPPLQRAALLLFYREGWSCQQIAQALGVPLSTVKSHMHRARAKLRKRLSGESIKDWSALKFGE